MAPIPGLLYVTMQPKPSSPTPNSTTDLNGPGKGLPEWVALYDITDTAELTKDTYTRLRTPAVKSQREKDVMAQIAVDRRTFDFVESRQAESFRPLEDLDVEEEEGARCEHIKMLSKVPGWLRTRRYVTSSIDEKDETEYLALHEYAPENGLGGEEFKAATSTKWTDEVMANVVREKRRRVYKSYYIFGPAPRDLAPLSSPDATPFSSPDGLTKTFTASGDAGPAIESYVTTKDGVMLPYRLEGSSEPDAPLILLSNSILVVWGIWDGFVASFLSTAEGKRYRILRYSTRGRSKNAGDQPVTLDVLASDVITLLDAFRVRKAAALIGVSLGGATVLNTALKYPGRVAYFVACDTNAVAPESNRKAWGERIAMAEKEAAREAGERVVGEQLAEATVRRWFVEESYDKGSMEKEIERVKTMVRTNSLEGFKKSVVALYAYDVREEMKESKVKGAFVVGGGDGVLPKTMKQMAADYGNGAESSKKQDGKVRQWQCETCQAVNYLDEVHIPKLHLNSAILTPTQNGQITDPPAIQTPTGVQFAQPVLRSTSPELSAPADNLFCSTCLKNQHILTTALASYLPPPSDPRYREFEDAAAEYRNKLERRYPQVCADCAPRVERRIRAAGYAAKTDHLRRMMAKTQGGGTRSGKGKLTWRDVVLLLAGVAWWTSLAGQLAWDLLGALVSLDRDVGLRPEDSWVDVAACVWQAVRYKEVERSCFAWSTYHAGVALALGVVSCWWNNKLRAKLQEPSGRLGGLSEHLRLQAVVLIVRAASIWMLHEPEDVSLSLAVFRAAHLFMVVFMVMTTFVSARLVKIDHTPLVSFQDSVGSLLPEQQQPAGDASADPLDLFSALPDASKTPLKQSSAYIRPFPINNLAGPTPSSQLLDSLATPSTARRSSAHSIASTITATETDYDPDNAMEWTPTKPSDFGSSFSSSFSFPSQQHRKPLFQPSKPGQLSALDAARNTITTQSPFHGTLPPRPSPPPTNSAIRRNTTSSDRHRCRNSKSFDLPPAVTGRRRGAPELAEGKLRLREEMLDTGLEGLFSSVFSLGEAQAPEPRVEGVTAVGERGEGAVTSGWDKRWAVGLAAAVAMAALGVMGSVGKEWWKARGGWWIRHWALIFDLEFGLEYCGLWESDLLKRQHSLALGSSKTSPSGSLWQELYEYVKE
ncbi:hypothetical protein H2199_004758 [Coniosporium tulheliwenetii]|uniref:Uncharacterized protein n=1 Tax=Coniosporium tulheliwenetii TaxID=3383036 RepID=A0ACC2Z409_9PEZI|nr:hypothetical protein H2199_004758 [Cladosporium sp. JES 115]